MGSKGRLASLLSSFVTVSLVEMELGGSIPMGSKGRLASLLSSFVTVSLVGGTLLHLDYLKELVLLHIIFSRGKMEAIISIVEALASKAAEYTVEPAARQLGYLFKARSKFQNLRTKVRDLEEARQRLQQSVEAATRNGEVIFDDVQRWLTEVDGKISGQVATQMREDEEKATKRCLGGFAPILSPVTISVRKQTRRPAK
ncbi:hypothetical protein GQ457_02G040100 [Hibiscus cannabinus]